MRVAYVMATMITLGAVAPVAAQGANETQSKCLRDLTDVESKFQPVREHLQGNARRGVATLKSAAVYLSNTGKEDACEDVVEAIGEVFSSRESELVSAGVLRPRDERVRLERLKQAGSKIGKLGTLRARDLIGTEVRNLQDDDLGDVEDIIVNPSDGTASHLLVSVGGFLGVGEDFVAVPSDSIGFTDAMDVVVLKISKNVFENAPKVTQLQLDSATQDNWRNKADDYFKSHVRE